jgi:hypothetical protein
MRQPSQKFSIAVSGSGRLQGMFFTECMARFPHATVYDRSDGTTRARREEASLGQTENASPDFRKLAIKTEKNIADPTSANVGVSFLDIGQLETVGVVSRGFNKRLTFNFATGKSLSEMEAFIQKVVDAVAQSG